MFPTPEDLDSHFMAVTSCELSLAEPAEGITSNIEKQLRSRKKTHRDQTEAERWEQIYRILFPLEPVPSPCELCSISTCSHFSQTSFIPPCHQSNDMLDFEPVQDDAVQSPESRELADYEHYSR